MPPTPPSRGFSSRNIPANSPNPAKFPHYSRGLKVASALFSACGGIVCKRFLLGVQEVPSSNLGGPTMFSIAYASLILRARGCQRGNCRRVVEFENSPTSLTCVDSVDSKRASAAPLWGLLWVPSLENSFERGVTAWPQSPLSMLRIHLGLNEPPLRYGP